jgi:cation diffusion facilitator CzcD-associated flavoprotein CzcO
MSLGSQHSKMDCYLEAERTFEDQADVLIMARGGLNHIAWPKIDGLRSFEGEIMHSADWKQE